MENQILQKAEELGFREIAFFPAQSMSVWEEDLKLRKIIDPSSSDYWNSRGLTDNFRTIMPAAKTIIAAVYPYLPYQQAFPKGQGSYSAHYTAYPKGHEAITKLGELLAEKGYEVCIDPPIPAKRLAYESGLGKYGKNGLIYHSTYGSFITLHTILTSASLKCKPIDLDGITDCGSCNKCIEACPMQAIEDNGLVLLTKCMRYYMFSSKKIVPIEVREKMGNRMLGCEECQIVCPKNRMAIKQAVQLKTDYEIFNIREILSNAKTGLKKYMSPIAAVIGDNYARPQKVLSMAVIAAGNSEDLSYVPLLGDTLQYPNAVIRAHSAWALGKLGGDEAKFLLLTARSYELEMEVKGEIDLALKKIESQFTGKL